MSFSKDVQAVLDNRCVHCHYDPSMMSSPDAPHKPAFNAGSSYANLVSAPVPCNANAQLVVPGDTNASALLGILSGTPVCGSVMPKSTSGLANYAPVEFGVIQRWIQQGAPNN